MFDISENLKKLPDTPGVYMHKDDLGQVIYVGKAVSLKNRVRQYFQSSRHMDPKVRAMVSHIAEFEYITTVTEMEALILENNLIKKYMPRYNVLLRDDKTFPYIKVTLAEDYPRILKTRRIEKDGAKYFGPFSDAGAVNVMVDLLNDIYHLKRCGARRFPSGAKPCLNYHIGNCRGTCTGTVSQEEYRQTLSQVMDFLSGKSKGVMDYLKREMTAAAEAMEYERAAKFRDYIEAAAAVTEKQRVVILGVKDMDIVMPVRGSAAQQAALFFVREGKLSGREIYHLQAEVTDSPAELIAAFLTQYYTEGALIPREILVPGLPTEGTLIEEMLSELAGRSVKITVPQKGDKRALMELAKKDVTEMEKTADDRARLMRERRNALGTALQQILFPEGTGFDGREFRAEAYDISNTGGVDSVGAMVVFEGMTPKKKDYRRFRIRTIEGANDTGSLQEVLYRRLKRAKEGDPGFAKLPDFFLIDGGKNQVSAVSQVLAAMKVEIPVLGMAKDDHHRTRALILDEEEILLSEHPVLFKYIGTVQEEVHRFAVDYHRGLRGKKMQGSALDEIEGVGPTRRNALLAHFGSIEKIKSAGAETLCQVPGITKPVAEKIVEYFR